MRHVADIGASVDPESQCDAEVFASQKTLCTIHRVEDPHPRTGLK
jgi:hypothetical protein